MFGAHQRGHLIPAERYLDEFMVAQFVKLPANWLGSCRPRVALIFATELERIGTEISIYDGVDSAELKIGNDSFGIGARWSLRVDTPYIYTVRHGAQAPPGRKVVNQVIACDEELTGHAFTYLHRMNAASPLDR
jgi:hypothetical protein